MKALIARHAAGDWGDLDSHDRDENDRALKYGGGMFSAYTISSNGQDSSPGVSAADSLS